MNIENIGSDFAGKELLRLLPPVLRAREFHLYLDNGRRLTDLWQFGGAAILGHKPNRVVTELKNAAERGLFVPLPHPAEHRFKKSLSLLFRFPKEPQYTFRIYADKYSLVKALEKAGFLHDEIPDPAFPQSSAFSKTSGLPSSGENEPQKILPLSLWRPFLGNKNFLSSVYLPVLPWPLAPHVLVLDNSQEDRFLPGDLVSPVLLAAGTRAIYDLIASGDQGSRPRYLKIEKALASNKKWRRCNIYLTCSPESQDDYMILWKSFLEKGFLLPPSPTEPLILPGSLSPGEEAKLAGLLAESY